MGSKKITELTADTDVLSTDLTVIVADPGSSPVTKKVTIANLYHGFIYEPVSSFNMTQFTIPDRERVSKTIDSNAEWGNDGVTWISRRGSTFIFPTWTLGANKAGLVDLVEYENRINDTGVELAACSAYSYNLVANAKAGVYGYDCNMIKQNPCVTDNTFVCFNALMASTLTPPSTSYLSGTAFAARSSTYSGYTGTRQMCGLYIAGNAGWLVPILVQDTDGVTTLFAVDQYGAVQIKSMIKVGSVPYYANNAAALAGGLTAGMFYQDASDPSHVCVVY